MGVSTHARPTLPRPATAVRRSRDPPATPMATGWTMPSAIVCTRSRAPLERLVHDVVRRLRQGEPERDVRELRRGGEPEEDEGGHPERAAGGDREGGDGH